jgi:hypothetical protein
LSLYRLVIANADAMYDPPDTAERYRARPSTPAWSSDCSAPRLNAADRMPPPEQQIPMPPVAPPPVAASPGDVSPVAVSPVAVSSVPTAGSDAADARLIHRAWYQGTSTGLCVAGDGRRGGD